MNNNKDEFQAEPVANVRGAPTVPEPVDDLESIGPSLAPSLPSVAPDHESRTLSRRPSDVSDLTSLGHGHTSYLLNTEP